MNTIAFGGYAYPIRKWLPTSVTHYSCPAWGFRDAWCRKLAASIRQPTRLIGFSAGAEAALRVAFYSPHVTDVVFHSGLARFRQFRPECLYRFFVTKGDTTPTHEETIDLYLHYSPYSSRIDELPMEPFAKPTLFERWQLIPRNHIFHNCLPHLGLD